MIVWLKPCPMCKVPVTLGGGNWMLKEGLAASSVGANKPGSAHSGAHFASMAAGSKDLASSVMGRMGRHAPTENAVNARGVSGVCRILGRASLPPTHRSLRGSRHDRTPPSTLVQPG